MNQESKVDMMLIDRLLVLQATGVHGGPRDAAFLAVATDGDWLYAAVPAAKDANAFTEEDVAALAWGASPVEHYSGRPDPYSADGGAATSGVLDPGWRYHPNVEFAANLGPCGVA